jgi:hypothetical protein
MLAEAVGVAFGKRNPPADWYAKPADKKQAALVPAMNRLRQMMQRAAPRF